MEFRFPDVGEGLNEAKIVRWLKKTGDMVKMDEAILEIETDKAVVEIPSPIDAEIGKIFFKEGDIIHVGNVLLELLEKKSSDREKSGVVGSIKDADSIKFEAEGPLFSALKKTANSSTSLESSSVKLLPRLRKLADDLGVSLNALQSLNKAEITENDILNLAKSTVLKAEDKYGKVEKIILSDNRRRISAHLSLAKNEVISVTQVHHLDITELSKFRDEIKENFKKDGVSLTPLSFLVMAMIKTIESFPVFNAEYDKASLSLLVKKYVNLGLAVDTKDGLMVPVIVGAEKMSLIELAKNIQITAEKARNSEKLLLTGSSITVTNYGSLGSIYSTPIINYPNTCILGVGAAFKNLFLKDNKVQEKLLLPISLTFDHRFIDGADAAKFLNKLGEYLIHAEYFRSLVA